MSRAVMLTTIDNPFNPFTQWDEWKRYDQDKKHFSCSLLDRIAKTSHELSDEEYNKAIEDAINEIITINASGLHRKVYEDETI